MKPQYHSQANINIVHIIKKIIVLTVSITFVSFNVMVAHAQTDQVEDDTVDQESGESDSTSIIDVLENTEEEPETEPEPDNSSSGGGSSAGVFLGLAAVGALVYVIVDSNSKEKTKAEPKIQKTFTSDKVSGTGGWLVDLSPIDKQFHETQNTNGQVTLADDVVGENSSVVAGRRFPLSFQYGAYDSITGLATPFTLINTRLSANVSPSIRLHADSGLSLFNQEELTGSLFDSQQWLSLKMSASSVFNAGDLLELGGSYVIGDMENQGYIGQGLAWGEYGNIISPQKNVLQLAYSQSLGQNSLWQFSLQKSHELQSNYDAKLAWRYQFQ